jgi:hypothetical protein
MAWAHGTVGIADVCAPSWAGRSERDITYLNHWLDQGYAVVASDYQGLGTGGGHPYLIARPEASSVLDSVRHRSDVRRDRCRQTALLMRSRVASDLDRDGMR